MDSVYIKVSVLDRLPKISSRFFTDEGECFFHEKGERWSNMEDDVTQYVSWWLEEITLPTEEDKEERMFNHSGISTDSFNRGFEEGYSFLSDHIKKAQRNG